MYATSVRSFQKSAVRMSAAAPTVNAGARWAGYFAGITLFTLAGAGVLYKYNEDHHIKNGFKRHNINNINGSA